MEFEREQVVEAAVSVIAVVIMLGVFYYIGATFGDDGLSSDGGLYLVGSIVLFIVLMGATGLYLAYTISEGTSEDTDVAGFE
jgi:hypothetical protein